jgi:hypothetical protein
LSVPSLSTTDFSDEKRATAIFTMPPVMASDVSPCLPTLESTLSTNVGNLAKLLNTPALFPLYGIPCPSSIHAT